MKAILCKEYGPPSSLVYEDVVLLPPGENEVKITIKACGISFPDSQMILGEYQFKPELPFSPGSEVAGVVTEIGVGVDNVAVGDRVLAITQWGGYAGEAVSPKISVIQIPDDMDFVTAAGFNRSYGTAIHGLRDRALIEPGETLLVIGTRAGVSFAAVEVGKILGAKVIAASHDEEGLENARELGADETVNLGELNLRSRIRELTNDEGADVIYDLVGNDADSPSVHSIHSLAWGGRLLVTGFVGGEIPHLPLNLVLFKACQVIGVHWPGLVWRRPEIYTKNMRQLFDWYGEGKIHPSIWRTFPLQEAPAALETIFTKQARGKIVLTMD